MNSDIYIYKTNWSILTINVFYSLCIKYWLYLFPYQTISSSFEQLILILYEIQLIDSLDWAWPDYPHISNQSISWEMVMYHYIDCNHKHWSIESIFTMHSNHSFCIFHCLYKLVDLLLRRNSLVSDGNINVFDSTLSEFTAVITGFIQSDYCLYSFLFKELEVVFGSGHWIIRRIKAIVNRTTEYYHFIRNHNG